MTTLLCFSGRIGSGKSSVSTAVAATLGWPRTGFSDYLRAEMRRLGGDPDSRGMLQDFGRLRVEVDPVALCRDVLAFGGFDPGMNFVVDGIRHIDIFNVLRNVAAPSVARLIFLQAGESSRSVRIATRNDGDDFARAEEHPVEAELRFMLPQLADVVVDAERSFDEVVAMCVDFARAWTCRHEECRR